MTRPISSDRWSDPSFRDKSARKEARVAGSMKREKGGQLGAAPWRPSKKAGARKPRSR